MCQIYRIDVDYMVQIELIFSTEELHCKIIASTKKKKGSIITGPRQLIKAQFSLLYIIPDYCH